MKLQQHRIDIDSRASSDSVAWRTLLVLCGLLVVYGSLYPFRFAEPHSVAGAWQAFVSNGAWWTSTGDVVGNVLLFIPFGSLGVAVVSGPKRRTQRLAAFALFSFFFAFAIQAAQIYFPPRDASLADVLWNAVGTVVGIATALAIEGRMRNLGAKLSPDARSPVALLALWVVTQWAPLVPSLDWQVIKDNLKPLLLHPTISTSILLLAFARALAAGCLLAAIQPSKRRAAEQFALLLTAILIGKVFIVGQSINLSNVLGFAGGYACWLSMTKASQVRLTLFAAAVLFVAYNVSAFVPLDFRAAPVTFHVLPFEAMLEGSMMINSRALIDAIFIYGTVLWLLQRSGHRVLGSSVFLAMWVSCIEYAQVWIEGKTPDITDPLLVLALGFLLHWIHRPQARKPIKTREGGDALSDRPGRSPGAH